MTKEAQGTVKHRADVDEAAHSSLSEKLSTLTPGEARELAAELQVATLGHRLDYIRALHALEQLGVKWPDGLR